MAFSPEPDAEIAQANRQDVLDGQLLAPERIVLVGASRDPGSVGFAIWQNLLASAGNVELHAVNPHRVEAPGATWHATVNDLPPGPGLAIVALPARLVADAIAVLGEKGMALAVVVTAGLSSGNEHGRAMMEAAQATGVRIIGPNCIGLLLPRLGINASFAANLPPPGQLALLSQSGAIAASLIEWSAHRDIGFSIMLSLGDMADCGPTEMLELLGEDDATEAVLLYLEGLKNGPAFLAAARDVGQRKPVIVLKSGRDRAASTAALSHTGALAGSWDAYEAAFRAAGIVSVDSLDDLQATAGILRFPARPSGNRLAILTNGGGAGILALDALAGSKVTLARLAPDTLTRLDAILPSVWSKSNPIDIIGDAREDRYRAAVDIVLADAGCDMVLVMNCPTGLIDPVGGAAAVGAAVSKARADGCTRPVVGCWLGPANFRAAAPQLAKHGIACFSDPAAAAGAIIRLVERAESERAWPVPAQVRHLSEDALVAARKTISAARAEKRLLLTEVEAKELVSCFGISTVSTRLARDPEDLEKVCAALSPPYVVKIVSRDIAHKSDVGGVALGLANSREAARAAAAMAKRVSRLQPDAAIEGFAVQTMVDLRAGVEVFAGLSVDDTFGPMVMFGAGGKAIEVMADRALALPPLSNGDALDCIARTRIARLLAGYRDVPAADTNALATILVALGQIALALPEIVEIDLNPLLAGPDGAIALDARIVLAPTD